MALTDKVYQNRNPDDIKDVNWVDYYRFHNFLYNPQSSINTLGVTINGTINPFYSTRQGVVASWYLNPIINKNTNNITTQLMTAFNSYSTQIGLGSTITNKIIKAAQVFHNKTDPNVLIDGWVGTQTQQLKYPSFTTIFTSTFTSGTFSYTNFSELAKPIHGGGESEDRGKEWYAPVIWGNKRYVVKSSDIYKVWSDNKQEINAASININLLVQTTGELKNKSQAIANAKNLARQAYFLQIVKFNQLLYESNLLKEKYDSSKHIVTGSNVNVDKGDSIPITVMNYNQNRNISVQWHDFTLDSVSQKWFSDQPPIPADWPNTLTTSLSPQKLFQNNLEQANIELVAGIKGKVISLLS